MSLLANVLSRLAQDPVADFRTHRNPKSGRRRGPLCWLHAKGGTWRREPIPVPMAREDGWPLRGGVPTRDRLVLSTFVRDGAIDLR